MIDQGIPIVLFDRDTSEIECDKVVFNDQEIAYEAVEHLLKFGCKHIALVTTNSYFDVRESRREGFLDALYDHGIESDNNLILTLPYNLDNDSLILEFFQSNKMDGVLCVNEIFAIQCMSIIQQLGFVIPDDIVIIGFKNGSLSEFSNPRLTTVAQHGDEMGAEAAKLLIDRIESATEEFDFVTEIGKATLIKRGSTIN